MSTGDLRTETKNFLTFYGVFNSNFFHHIVSPFCISSQLKPIHIIFFGYISAFYPFLLIFVTWFCVELHGRNCRRIVCLWRPFHRCFVGLRRGWNTKSDLIDVFASFFLLSYSKVLYQFVLTVNNTDINNYSLVDGHESDEYALDFDWSIIAKSPKYFLIFTATILLSFMFIISPMLLLLLYPTIIFQRFLSKCTSNRFRIILNIFVEKFQCCYRDGLDGARDRRNFSGLYFLLRLMICFVEVMNRNTFRFETQFVRGFVFSVTVLLVTISRPYKKTYVNTVDSILLFHLATLCYIASSNYESRLCLQFLQTVIIFPFAIFCMLVAYRMVHGICKTHVQWLSLQRCLKAFCRVRAYDSFTPDDQKQIIQLKVTYDTMNLC